MTETAEALARKKKVRAAHRASVTRVVGQAREILSEGVVASATAKLTQKRDALTAKAELLRKLDSEIVEAVHEDELEGEIERADEVQEQIELLIIEIDTALRSVTLTDSGAARARDVPRDPTPTSEPRTTPRREDPPRSERTERDSSEERDLDPPPPEDTSSVHTDSLPVPPLSSNIKLPKLSLKKFGGDLTKWTTFWDTFESAVHRNPALTNIDKFSYLNSLLESVAAEAVAGLTLTSANYDEAVSTLKRRFGNKQSIVNRHMELLLHLEPVSSIHNLKGLRHLFDAVESNVRGLKALGISASSYGGLLSPILMGRLPPDLRLIVTRELTEDEWDVELVMEVLQREIEARERSVGTTSSQGRKFTLHKLPPTALSLTAGTTPVQPSCVYCGQAHISGTCQTVTDPEGRKQILRSSGRCFVCLRRNHLSRNCRSSGRCTKCRGRHHTSICQTSNLGTQTPTAPLARTPISSTHATPAGTVQPGATSTPTTSSMLVDSPTPILLQTAKTVVSDATQIGATPAIEVRALLDTGSQRSYVTERVREALGATPIRSETMIIKTFGAARGERKTCDVIQLRISTKDGEHLTLPTVVVPHICDPVSAQPINISQASYGHLAGLELADAGDIGSSLEVDLLIGSDHYWQVVTGQVMRRDGGPTALETRLGWVLSGPATELPQETTINYAFTQSSHTLRVDAIIEPESLDAGLKRFWELESLGIHKEEHPVQQQFSQKISFKQGRYEVHLPWRDSHPHLPDNYDLCKKRLDGLLKRLRQDPEKLRQYDAVIQDQLRQGVVEVVIDPTEHKGKRLHYLPHHGVFRHDKETTKLRVVYDGSAKSTGPSLNECLHTGPNFGQHILEILLRFRAHAVALIGDIEKAFLMVSVVDHDRDVLRFLWVHDANRADSDVAVLRFTRVVFGVSASPFLLNATIDHHLKKMDPSDETFVQKFRRSIYVDDVATSMESVDAAYQFYLQARQHLAKAGFNLRKFATNSQELLQKIDENEQEAHKKGVVQSSSCTSGPEPATQPVLGICWDVQSDQLLFDISDVACVMNGMDPTKRNAISIATRFYDPLGVLSPITVRFKQLFQKLCEKQVEWDEPLTEELLIEWESLTSDLQHFTPLKLPRCYPRAANDESLSLRGFCDASEKAYAAVVYLQAGEGIAMRTQFLCSKTRVAPVKKMTIPRLELLSALLLARLISTVRRALEQELQLENISCYTDSQVALCWITGLDREWKQFVMNRVIEIRSLVPPSSWKHCPGTQNPADIPSRGVSSRELEEKMTLWLHGPSEAMVDPLIDSRHAEALPEECLAEMKTKKEKSHTTLVTQSLPIVLLPCERYSCLRRLIRVTAYILKFIGAVRVGADGSSTTQTGSILTAQDLNSALTYWIKMSQLTMSEMKNFDQWKLQFGLYRDGSGIWRCRGRLGNSHLPEQTKHPILLHKEHHLTLLIVRECHKRVMHGGVKTTLTEIRSKYWIVQGRSFVRGVLQKCVVCRRFQGRPYASPPAPPLPAFRVNEARPFAFTGVDFAGPLFVRDTVSSTARKVWLCLYTCCVTRAAHLDIVPDMTSETFLRCFRRFAARRGFPTRMVSDNAKTFKAASRTVMNLVKASTVHTYLSDIGIKWVFNVERAPWWGGIFERMIQTAKRCMRKVIGNARLTYEELLTVVVEVEMTLNSRPLSYVSSEDLDEPLTPSHLLCGHRVLSLPDPDDAGEDPDYNTTHEGLTRRMRHLSKILADFWKRWRSEYLLELRDMHRHFKRAKGVDASIGVGDVVVIHDENLPRGLWRLGRVKELISGADGHVRCAAVEIASRNRGPTSVKRPLQRLYPLELQDECGNEATVGVQEKKANCETLPTAAQDASPTRDPSMDNDVQPQPRRQAFRQAQETIRAWCKEL